jgi:hypothetical protein
MHRIRVRSRASAIIHAPGPPYENPVHRGLAELAGCRSCGALFYQGRRSWDASRSPTRPRVCPTCRNLQSLDPAGIVTEPGGAHPGDMR